jgi:hypothetical protein
MFKTPRAYSILLATDLCANAFFAIATFDSVFDDVIFREALVETSESVQHGPKKEKADNMTDESTTKISREH